jgi:hypothetical protein
MKMDKKYIQHLLDRFHSGRATESEMSEIESLIADGEVSLNDVQELSALQSQVDMLGTPMPSPSLDRRFYQMLSEAQGQRKSAFSWNQFFSWPAFAPRLALASVMLIAGIAAGYFLRPGVPAQRDQQIEVLSQQVSDLQEMMMLSLLEKGSATERLRAVGLTLEMDEASKKVTAALIRTLNDDENVNVRLAALEALKPYATDSSVREALIRSIAKQESPLVQVSLAELMVALQEKAAATEFEKLVESDNTPAEVKKKLRESIKVLI